MLLRATLDRQVDHGVLLADRVESLLELLDVDDDRDGLDPTVDRNAVADPGDLALRTQSARRALVTGRVPKRDSELSDFHDVLFSRGQAQRPGGGSAIPAEGRGQGRYHMNSELIESPW